MCFLTRSTPGFGSPSTTKLRHGAQKLKVGHQTANFLIFREQRGRLLCIGQRTDTGALGSVGLLLRNAPDVMTALKELVANLDLHDRSATCFLDISGNDAILGYEVYAHGVAGTDQVSDCAIAVGWNIMRTLCGQAWLPREVCLQHDHPPDIEPYRRFFNAPP